MRYEQLGITAALALLAGSGCGYDDSTGDNQSATTPTDGSPSGGGPGTMDTGTDGPATVAPNPIGPGTGPTPVGPDPTGPNPGAPGECTDVAACGGDVVGTWTVSSSCLELAGDYDVFLTSLACPTVPAVGSLQTTGTLSLNADGTYTDNTTTTGTITFPLDSTCLAISGIAVGCDRVGSIFGSMGWNSHSCSEATGVCNCTLTTEQEGGMGAILSYTEPTGRYTASGNTLTASNATYSYCASTDTLTVTPQMSTLTGQVTLQRDGTTPGVGGTSGMGGNMSGGGTPGVGGNMSGGGTPGVGGMSGGEGGTMSGGGTPGVGGNMAEGGSGGDDGNPSTIGPCDIYEAAGTACVAAHSTVRALFGSFDGNLYQVRRADGMMQDIPVLSPGGFADSAVQDAFCEGSSCTIWRLYDQTGNGNFLEAQTPDSTVGGNNGMTAANAEAESLTVGGHQVYSLFTRPAQAYWNDGSETGMPLAAEPQGVYMVTSGEHFNEGCCYNYGNGQLNRMYSGGPMMDAVYFGNNTIWGTGAGEGPWVMADMEDGMLAWGNGGNNPNSVSLPFPYVTAMEKNNGTSQFALKGADATQPTLTTMWNGALPGTKSPMRKEGAVILGAGGDCCYSNNNASEGTFYEGAIVAGYPSDETDEEIHANIVETGYGQ